MNNKLILSPFVIIKYNDKINKFILKNNIYKYECFEIDKVSNLVPCDETIRKKIFIQYNELLSEKNRCFNLLENSFINSPDSLGYIETTSKCPFKCKMCPKGNNLIVRKNESMSITKFTKILSQLNNQDDIALHLFGDPLFDKEIYNKIEIANRCRIKPSMSTNLVSLSLLNLQYFKKLSMNTLIISCDSVNIHDFEIIRGKINENVIDKSIKLLNELILINDKFNIVNKIIVQYIKLNVNENERKKISEINFGSQKVIFYEKPFINFPMTNASYLQDNNNDLKSYKFLNNVLNKKLPFKCLKVWNKKEYAINSDGDLLPCCLSFNNTSNLGNCFEYNISQLFRSDELKKFRWRIYNKMKCGSICDCCCATNDANIKVEGISDSDIKKLSKYCVEDW